MGQSISIEEESHFFGRKVDVDRLVAGGSRFTPGKKKTWRQHAQIISDSFAWKVIDGKRDLREIEIKIKSKGRKVETELLSVRRYPTGVSNDRIQSCDVLAIVHRVPSLI